MGHAPSPPRLPVLLVDSSFVHAIATTPVGPVGPLSLAPVVVLGPTDASGGLPQRFRRVGSHITRFEACSAFTRVTACTLADSLKEPFPRSASVQFVTSLNRSRCYRSERLVTGRDSHPLESTRLSRHTHRRARELRDFPAPLRMKGVVDRSTGLRAAWD